MIFLPTTKHNKIRSYLFYYIFAKNFSMKIFISLIVSFILLTAAAAPVLSQPAKQPASPAPSAKIQWIDMKELADLNAKKPKKVFVDMYTSWCGWCKKMDQSTFINPVIVDYMNKNYYAVKFNAERKDEVEFKGKKYVNANPSGGRSSHQLAQLMLNNRMSYPSFVFLDENMDMITVVPGYRKAPEFEAIMHFIAEDAYKTKSWEQFRATFKGSAKE